MLYGYNAPGNIGVGPFVAGYSTASYQNTGWNYYANIVWWSDLNSANVCNPATASVSALAWGLNHGLCPNGSYVAPPQAVGIQACVVLATILAAISGLVGFSITPAKSGGAGIALCLSFSAMVFTIATFAIWTTWPMSLALQSSTGSRIPVWGSEIGGPMRLTTTPNNVRVYYSWTYVMTIFSFMALLISSFGFANVVAQSRKEDEEEQGDFGVGRV